MPFTRKLAGHRLSLAAVLALAASASAQGGVWSDAFDRPGLLGRVFAVSEYGGEIVAGGLSVEADGQEFGNVARFDGQRWRSIGAGIHGFVVEDFAIYQGELVAAGNFDQAGGVPVKSIASWDGSQWRPLGGGIGLSFAVLGTVYALAVYQNELYAAGMFDRADNLAVANVARWDGTQWRAVGSGFDGDVYALEVGGDGKLYAGGAFGAAGGTSAANIASWNGTNWSAVGPGIGVPFNSPVRALEWHASKLWAGGYFDLPGGALYEKLASWNGSTWQASGSFPDSAIGTQIYSLLSVGTDLYVGGNIVSVDGIPIERIARLSGTQWNSIGGVRGFANSNVVLALAVHAGELVVGGNFTHAGKTFGPGGPVVSNSVARFDGTDWKQIGQGLGFDSTVSGGMLWNGGLVVVGNFNEAGRSIAPFVALFDGNDWTPLGNFNGPGYEVTVFQNELIVSGFFTSVDGQSITGVAAYTGTSWHGFGSGFGGGYGGQTVAVYQNQLYAGTIGGVMRWNGATWETFAPQIFGSVVDLHVHNGVLYIAGYFTTMGGNIASWDGTTQQLVGGGMNGSVSTLTSFGSDLVAGGEFTQAGGVPAKHLARWNGSTWSGIPGVTGSSVDDLAVFGGALHASGGPLLFGTTTSYVARLNGAQWQPLGTGPNGRVAVLIPDDAAGKLYAGGLFQDAGGRPSWNFGVWIPSSSAAGAPYCTAGTTSNGCVASISGNGTPSASSSSAFSITVAGVEGQKQGILYYGVNGATAVPWGAGSSLLCVRPPTQRTGSQFSGGAAGACNGVLSLDWNAWVSANPSALGQPLTVGATVWAQGWFRDPPAPKTTNLSNALEFTLTQ